MQSLVGTGCGRERRLATGGGTAAGTFICHSSSTETVLIRCLKQANIEELILLLDKNDFHIIKLTSLQ